MLEIVGRPRFIDELWKGQLGLIRPEGVVAAMLGFAAARVSERELGLWRAGAAARME